MVKQVWERGRHNAVVIPRQTAATGDDLPSAKPSTIVDVRSILKLPLAEKARLHVLVFGHYSLPWLPDAQGQSQCVGWVKRRETHTCPLPYRFGGWARTNSSLTSAPQ